MIIVPATNCRMVRPREMRARNSPTKADQAIHQAQKNSVQNPIQSPVSENAKVCMLMSGNSRT
jgi:hypothetical protein